MAQSTGRHSGEVTIAADRAEILQGIDDLVFTVTREFATGNALDVPVTLSRGILPFSRLSHTVTIPARSTSATLKVSTFQRISEAVTGDVTATVADGPDHDVGDPSSASTHVHVGRGLVSLSFSSSSMRVGEGVGSSRDEVRLIARTSPNVPPPREGFSVSVFTGERTAKRGVDYRGFSRTFPIYGEPRGNWVADGDTYVSSTQVTVWPIDDDLDEGDEHFAVQVQTLPSHPPAVRLVPPDPSAPPCARSFCVSNVVIVDDDTRGVTVSETGTLLVDEGDTASYTVVLDSEPTGDVTVTPAVEGADGADISVSAPLTFTPRNWNRRQPVTVTAGVDDNAIDGSATIVHAVSGGDYGDRGVIGPSVAVREEDSEADQECTSADCDNTITIIDDDVESSEDTEEPGDADQSEETEEPGDTDGPQGTDGPEDAEEEPEVIEEAEAVVVTLVHVPDGTVIPSNSTVKVGGTVIDGTTFAEDEQVFFRLLFSAADGGPAPRGVDVDLSFQWTHFSPIVPTSGEVSRIGMSLHRVDVWDSAVQILDNDVGNPDSTVTIRITGCGRNTCVIGEPSEITVTIADDDGGPAAAVPGQPEPPRLVCAAAGDGYDSTGIDVSWQAPSFVGGAPINGYDVQYQRRISGGDQWVWGDWQAWSHSGTTTSTTITGLDDDSFYAVRVRAVNANGPGQWSLGAPSGRASPTTSARSTTSSLPSWSWPKRRRLTGHLMADEKAPPSLPLGTPHEPRSAACPRGRSGLTGRAITSA